MYLGRIVAIGLTPSGKPTAMYRVSSRSFPNREAVAKGETVSIMPRAGFEDDLKKSPYIAYHCVRIAGHYGIVSNGSHTDPIAEKIAMGMPPRDAITMGLLAMDYEKDAYDTPRIVAVVDKTSTEGFLGIIRKDAVLVCSFKLTPGTVFYLSTYEKNSPSMSNIDPAFNAETAEAVSKYVISGGAFAEFDHPVTSAAIVAEGAGFAIATTVA